MFVGSGTWVILSLLIFVSFSFGSSPGKNHKAIDVGVDNISNADLRYEFYTNAKDGTTHHYAELVWPTFERTDKSGGVTKKCLEYLDSFSNATTKFMRCVMTNARPLHYCENCVGEFSQVEKIFTLISNSTVKNKTTTCEEELLRADNVQVVLLAYDFVQNVWDKSTCHNCYFKATVNGTTVYHATNETLTMLKKIKDTQDCFHDFSPSTVPFSDDIGNMTVCSLCENFYSKANDYYNQLDEDSKLCSDLIDSMNYTRRMWSKEFHCTVAKRDDLVIYSISIAIAFLPVILYVGAYLYVEKQEKRQRRPSRASIARQDPVNVERVQSYTQVSTVSDT